MDRDIQKDLRKRDNLLTGEGREGGRGAESYDPMKAWSSMNHSILSDVWNGWGGGGGGYLWIGSV